VGTARAIAEKAVKKTRIWLESILGKDLERGKKRVFDGVLVV